MRTSSSFRPPASTRTRPPTPSVPLRCCHGWLKSASSTPRRPTRQWAVPPSSSAGSHQHQRCRRARTLTSRFTAFVGRRCLLAPVTTEVIVSTRPAHRVTSVPCAWCRAADAPARGSRRRLRPRRALRCRAGSHRVRRPGEEPVEVRHDPQGFARLRGEGHQPSHLLPHRRPCARFPRSTEVRERSSLGNPVGVSPPRPGAVPRPAPRSPLPGCPSPGSARAAPCRHGR